MLLLLLAAACGYRAATPYRARGGAERIHVRAFENDSADPELGAAVTARPARRAGAARGGGRRGRAGPAGRHGPGHLRGALELRRHRAAAWPVEVRGTATPTSGKLVHELTLLRTEAHQGGADALEAEGRRATALRKLAREAAREVLRELEEGAARAPPRRRPSPRPASRRFGVALGGRGRAGHCLGQPRDPAGQWRSCGATPLEAATDERLLGGREGGLGGRGVAPGKRLADLLHGALHAVRTCTLRARRFWA